MKQWCKKMLVIPFILLMPAVTACEPTDPAANTPAIESPLICSQLDPITKRLSYS